MCAYFYVFLHMCLNPVCRWPGLQADHGVCPTWQPEGVSPQAQETDQPQDSAQLLRADMQGKGFLFIKLFPSNQLLTLSSI